MGRAVCARVTENALGRSASFTRDQHNAVGTVAGNQRELEAAKQRLEDSVQELGASSRTLLRQVALPFACGAVAVGVALWLFQRRRQSTFALVNFAPQAPSAPSRKFDSAWLVGARLVLPQLVQLLGASWAPKPTKAQPPPRAQ